MRTELGTHIDDVGCCSYLDYQGLFQNERGQWKALEKQAEWFWASTELHAMIPPKYFSCSGDLTGTWNSPGADNNQRGNLQTSSHTPPSIQESFLGQWVHFLTKQWRHRQREQEEKSRGWDRMPN